MVAELRAGQTDGRTDRWTDRWRPFHSPPLFLQKVRGTKIMKIHLKIIFAKGQKFCFILNGLGASIHCKPQVKSTILGLQDTSLIIAYQRGLYSFANPCIKSYDTGNRASLVRKPPGFACLNLFQGSVGIGAWTKYLTFYTHHIQVYFLWRYLHFESNFTEMWVPDEKGFFIGSGDSLDLDKLEQPGPRLNIKTVLSTYGDFHVKDKTAVRTSYL